MRGLVAVFAVACTTGPVPPRGDRDLPPVAERRPHRVVRHGDVRIDPYHWLRDQAAVNAWIADNSRPIVLRDRAVIDHIAAENAYADRMMQRLEPLRRQLIAEMKSRVAEVDLGVPETVRGYSYYTKQTQGQPFPVHLRRSMTTGEEEVVVDVNALAGGKTAINVEGIEVSPDSRRVAYGVDLAGTFIYTLHVADLASGKVIQVAEGASAQVAWSADSQYLFYATNNEARRVDKVFRHRIGGPVGNDPLVYREDDVALRISELFLTRSGAQIILFSRGHANCDAHFIPADQPEAAPRRILAKLPDHVYDVDHAGDSFYVRTSRGAPGFRVMKTPVADPGIDHWTEVIAGRPDVDIEQLQLFAGTMVLLVRKDGLHQIEIVDLSSRKVHPVEVADPVYELSLAKNPSFNSGRFRFSLVSPARPESLRQYELATGHQQVLKEATVPGFDDSRYQTERTFATARDGERIPISLVYRKGMVRDGKNPIIVWGYGSYGSNVPLQFGVPWGSDQVTPRVSLLDRGVIWAFAHARGGGERGRRWYLDGKLMTKQNTFHDFEAVLEHLIAAGYSSADRIAIEGYSAGGLWTGWMVNNRPDLVRAAYINKPFVDLLTTMEDASLPLTTDEYTEWGNPADPAAYRYMKAYSPYDNIGRHDYPAILVRTAVSDTAVMYFEPVKWVAKLRHDKTDRRPLVLRVDAGGHSGATAIDASIREQADAYAFLLDQIGTR